MHFDILTLFPGLFAGVFEESIIKRAREAGLLSIALHDIRAHATGRTASQMILPTAAGEA